MPSFSAKLLLTNREMLTLKCNLLHDLSYGVEWGRAHVGDFSFDIEHFQQYVCNIIPSKLCTIIITCPNPYSEEYTCYVHENASFGDGEVMSAQDIQELEQTTR
jgi:hypothetical protein